jgi:uncharacterized membrane protein YkvA (DUF1232 family)
MNTGLLRAVIDRFLLTWRLMRDPRVPLWSKAIPVLGVIYVLSPLDFIPDFLIGLGQLDDLGIVLLSMRLFEATVPAYIVGEHREAVKRRHQPLAIIEGSKRGHWQAEDEREKATR